ncbi:hypothetical protein B484DRAFT_423302, partial [Ochromonadaceae sp. CCMP2298]
GFHGVSPHKEPPRQHGESLGGRPGAFQGGSGAVRHPLQERQRHAVCALRTSLRPGYGAAGCRDLLKARLPASQVHRRDGPRDGSPPPGVARGRIRAQLRCPGDVLVRWQAQWRHILPPLQHPNRLHKLPGHGDCKSLPLQLLADLAGRRSF